MGTIVIRTGRVLRAGHGKGAQSELFKGLPDEDKKKILRGLKEVRGTSDELHIRTARGVIQVRGELKRDG